MGVQVDLATHKRDSEGNLIPLSINKRQFISFTYGGEKIENFDLLAVFANDRLDKEMYFSFNDITSKNDVVDGHFFWSSIFNEGRLSFLLATDGMTSENYEKFKNCFRPGEIKELILSEFPNRAILARVATPPRISLLPFEDKKTFMINGKTQQISTSLYKGDISLEFVMDDPYWYSKESYIDDSSGSYEDTDLKIIFEDKIPSIKMFSSTDTFLLANGKIIQNGSVSNNAVINVNSSSPLYLYNCGTSAAHSKISFSIVPSFDSNGYISSPGNSYVTNKQSYLKIGSQFLYFTTPGLFTSYNHALKIINEAEINSSVLKARQRIRDELHNHYTRSWAMATIDGIKDSSGIINANFKTTFCNMMKIYIQNSTIKCSIDSKTGEVTMTTKCKIAKGPLNSLTASGMSEITVVENAGDMIKSKYLKLEDRTIFNAEGKITSKECSNAKIESSCDLLDFKILFKYTYL